MAEQINHGRRRLLGTAVLTLAAAELATIGSAYAQSRKGVFGSKPRLKVTNWLS